MFERTLDDILWALYPTRHYTKLKSCENPLDWHLSGECPECGVKAIRPSRRVFIKTLYTVEDSPHIIDALHFMSDNIMFTCREMQLPVYATQQERGTGVILKTEFFIPSTNTFVFVEKSWSKLPYYRKILREFDRRYAEEKQRIEDETRRKLQELKSKPKGWILKYMPVEEPVAVKYNAIFLLSKDGVVEQYVPNEKQEAKIIRYKVETAPDRVQVERLVNPKNASDICYVPLDVFEPLVEHYGGDKDRATRRWWRREIKRRSNKQYGRR